MGAELKLVVYGTPVPQGSKRAFYVKRLKRPVIVEDNKRTKPWRQEIAGAANDAMFQRGDTMVFADRAVAVECLFYFDRPKSLKKSVAVKITKPDTDKLIRTVLDGLTGTVFRDDSQVIDVSGRKRFDAKPRAEIVIKIFDQGAIPD